MAYITKHNAARIINESDLMAQSFNGDVYKKPIYFLNKLEQNSLLAYRELLEDGDYYKSTYYAAMDEDRSNPNYVVQHKDKAAYHKHQDCPKLNQDYRNMLIPEAIKEQGQDKVDEFRAWFMSNCYKLMLADKHDVIQVRIQAKYGFAVSQEYFKRFENSDMVDFNNYDTAKLELEIDLAIKHAGRFYIQNKKILGRFSKHSYLYKSQGIIENNTTGLSDDKLKDFLKNYHFTFKVPVMKMIREWYRLKLNKDLDFEGHVLDSLNFKPCSHCYPDGNTGEYLDINKKPFNDLPF